MNSINPPRSGTTRTMCPMNCHPTLCGMSVEVKDGALVDISGDPENPDSRGFLCVRGRAAKEIIGNPKRLLHPMIRDERTDDAWREASWDEALDLIVSRMNAVGRESVGLWSGHGNAANDYGFGIKLQLLERFANLYGCQQWHPAMICWGLGGFGMGLTGVLETNTKEDMAENAELIILWGANLTSQPNTIPHLKAARDRGARIVTIDIRRTEAMAQSDQALLIKPGTDAALALAMMNVMITENLYDRQFVEAHSIGFDQLKSHIVPFTPDWAAKETGIEMDQIVELAREYAGTKPAMIVLGGSSINKGANGWNASRAISCLPALTGNLGIPGSGLGPRHGSTGHGRALGTISAADRKPPGTYFPNQMPAITAALTDNQVKVFLLLGSNMTSSFADSSSVTAGLERAELVVCLDLFMSETCRRFADVVLPGTSWLEELGAKMTNTHLYLMDQILDPPGETRSVVDLLKGLADRLALTDYYPWASHEEVLDIVMDHPFARHSTVAALRETGANVALDVPHVGYPTHQFHTPSGKVEFYSERAQEVGLSPLPVHEPNDEDGYPLTLCQGRTLTQFHSFYDQGRALPSLAARNKGPQLWMSMDDAKSRGLGDGDLIHIYNDRGTFDAAAFVTEQIPAGVVWMRDGWVGLNNLTSGAASVPDDAAAFFPFSVGQAKFEAKVEVRAAVPG